MGKIPSNFWQHSVCNLKPRNLASRTYYAYGFTRTSSGTLQTDRTFTGQKADGTGLLYYNARYYDPALGTFLSPDTLSRMRGG